MTYDQLSPVQCAAGLLLLAVGSALILIAQRRNWRPSLAIAIYTALVLRLVMLALSYRTQPYDLVNDFQTAGFDVLHHRDPILNNRQNGWGSLPVYAFVLAGALWTSLHLHVSWLIISRIPAILCDLGVVVLVGAMPALALAVSGRHCADSSTPAIRLPSWSAACTARPSRPASCSSGAFVIVRAGPQVSGRLAGVAGILLGLGIATQTWPAVSAPHCCSHYHHGAAVRSSRREPPGSSRCCSYRCRSPSARRSPSCPTLPRSSLRPAPASGNWGWSGVWLTVHPTRLPVWADPLWLNAGSVGTKVAVVGALLAVWWWRRAHPLDIATATTTVLLAITPSFGDQYLVWQAPSATARPARLSMPLQIVLGAYAAIFYLPMQMLTWHNC